MKLGIKVPIQYPGTQATNRSESLFACINTDNTKYLCFSFGDSLVWYCLLDLVYHLFSYYFFKITLWFYTTIWLAIKIWTVHTDTRFMHTYLAPRLYPCPLGLVVMAADLCALDKRCHTLLSPTQSKKLNKEQPLNTTENGWMWWSNMQQTSATLTASSRPLTCAVAGEPLLGAVLGCCVPLATCAAACVKGCSWVWGRGRGRSTTLVLYIAISKMKPRQVPQTLKEGNHNSI